jgi:hypothetical protein
VSRMTGLWFMAIHSLSMGGNNAKKNLSGVYWRIAIFPNHTRKVFGRARHNSSYPWAMIACKRDLHRLAT